MGQTERKIHRQNRQTDQSLVEPGVLGLRHVTLHVGQGGSQAPQGGTEQHPVHLQHTESHILEDLNPHALLMII